MTRKGFKKNEKLIHEWLKGAAVETRLIRNDLFGGSGPWESTDDPRWHEDYEYRIVVRPEIRPYSPSDTLDRVGRFFTEKGENTEFELVGVVMAHGQWCAILRPYEIGLCPDRVLSLERFSHVFENAGVLVRGR